MSGTRVACCMLTITSIWSQRNDQGKFWTLINICSLCGTGPHLSDIRLSICVDQLVTVSLFSITSLGCELCLLIRMESSGSFWNSYWDVIAAGYCWSSLHLYIVLGVVNSSRARNAQRVPFAALTNLNWSWKASRSDKLSKMLLMKADFLRAKLVRNLNLFRSFEDVSSYS